MKKYGFLLAFLVVIFQITLAGIPEKKELSPDGPYILHEQNSGVRLIRVNETGEIKDTVYKTIPADFSFPVVSEDGKHRFEVKLHSFERQPYKMPQPEKLMVISDPHGNLECFVSILQGGGVIDEQYAWKFGKNQLVIIGDVFDRGKDVLPIFWLIYKLEQEAAEAGGQVSFMLGNHEEMVLRGDCRYTKDKYKELASELGISYQELWQQNSELGKWLKSRNLVQIIGENFFVHAGLSTDFLKRKESLEVLNETAGYNLFLSREQRKNNSDLSAFIFGSYGPFWYRGMVKSEDRYLPLSEKSLKRILKKYNVKRVIVGHTIFDDVTTFYNKRVIAVNVDNAKNRKKGRGRGILIDKENMSVLYDSGKQKALVP